MAQPPPRRPDQRAARGEAVASSTPRLGSSGSSRSSAGYATCVGRRPSGSPHGRSRSRSPDPVGRRPAVGRIQGCDAVRPNLDGVLSIDQGPTTRSSRTPNGTTRTRRAACGGPGGVRPAGAVRRDGQRGGQPDVLRVRLHRPARALPGDGRSATRSRSWSTTPTPRPRPTRARTDIKLAIEPGAHYVLVSTREHGNNEGPVEFRSYRIVDGQVTEEEVASSDYPSLRGAVQTWPSRSGSRPSCAPTPAARRPSRRGRQPERADRRPGGNHPGIKERLIENGDLRRFVNVYVNDEDVRFIGGLEAALSDGDQVVCCPRSPVGSWADRWPARQPPRLGRRTPLVGLPGCRRPPRSGCGPSSRTATRPARSRTGRRWHGRGGREGRHAASRLHDPRADVGQHRHLAGDGGQLKGYRWSA